MFSIFKKKEKKPALPQLADINNEPLTEGDHVEALRYELGECELILEDKTYFYISKSTGKKVSYLKMIDASTENQKVKKLAVD